jgi:predicted RNase H-like nuclease (RuvC/YqgF family)
MGLATVVYILIDTFVDWKKTKKNEQKEKQQNHEIKNIKDDVYDLQRQLSNAHTMITSLRGAYTEVLNKIEPVKLTKPTSRKKK